MGISDNPNTHDALGPLSNVYLELREINSRIDGLYVLLINGDIKIPGMITTESCKSCLETTHASIAELKNSMVSKAGFWSGVAVISFMSVLLGIIAAWETLIHS